MSPRVVTTTARSYSSGIPQRCICNARDQHFVMDDADYSDGPNEALIAAEAFLTGISGCAVLMVERFARERELSIGHLNVSIEASRDMDAPAEHHSVYDSVRMRFEFSDTKEEDALELVEAYQRH